MRTRVQILGQSLEPYLSQVYWDGRVLGWFLRTQSNSLVVQTTKELAMKKENPNVHYGIVEYRGTQEPRLIPLPRLSPETPQEIRDLIEMATQTIPSDEMVIGGTGYLEIRDCWSKPNKRMRKEFLESLHVLSKGVDSSGRPFVFIHIQHEGEHKFIPIFQRYVEGGPWVGPSGWGVTSQSQLDGLMKLIGGDRRDIEDNPAWKTMVGFEG